VIEPGDNLAEPRLVQVADVAMPDGRPARVRLYATGRLAPEAQVRFAMVFVQDAAGRFAAVFSPKRGEWGCPGGHREPGESVTDTALREVLEEAGLVLARERLRPRGYERFEPAAVGDEWPGGYLQVYSVRLQEGMPALRSSFPDAVDACWLAWDDLGDRCDHLFWWPLAEALFGAP